MYTVKNYKSKKALKADVEAGVVVGVFQPGPFGGADSGDVTLEGPHYPEPHRWYAKATLRDGAVVKVK